MGSFAGSSWWSVPSQLPGCAGAQAVSRWSPPGWAGGARPGRNDLDTGEHRRMIGRRRNGPAGHQAAASVTAAAAVCS